MDDLIRLATDEDGLVKTYPDPAAWAQIRAWRALGQLRAPEAVEPLLGTLAWEADADNGWALDEIPKVLGLIGAPALSALDEFIGLYGESEYCAYISCRGYRRNRTKSSIHSR